MAVASGGERVAFLGPIGTFTEEALLRSAREGAVEPIGCPTIYDTVRALREGAVQWALVPVENSLDGSVSVTLDLLADEGGELRIAGEVLLAVRHTLIAAAQVSLQEIETVLTHPQVPGQCTRLLRGELAHARVLAANSTAEAVRSVLEQGGRTAAAIGTRLAAELYGGTVLREGVQDRDDNETRFLWLAGPDRADVAAPLRSTDASAENEPERMKTSLVFWGEGAERPGWLLGCLSELAQRGLNLTKIESRPRRSRLGHYMFFADLQGDVDEQRVRDAIAGLREHCEEVLVLGSYRAA